MSSAASFSSPSDNGRKVKVNPIAAAADDVSPLSPDVIVLDVTVSNFLPNHFCILPFLTIHR